MVQRLSSTLYHLAIVQMKHDTQRKAMEMKSGCQEVLHLAQE